MNLAALAVAARNMGCAMSMSHDKVPGRDARMFRVRLERDGTAVEAVCDTLESAAREAVASMERVLRVTEAAMVVGDPPTPEPVLPGAR